MPRWSTAVTSKSRASVGISSHQAYQLSGQPCTSSSASDNRVQTQLTGIGIPARERVGARTTACRKQPGRQRVFLPFVDVEGKAHGTPTATGGIATVWTSDVTYLILRLAPATVKGVNVTIRDLTPETPGICLKAGASPQGRSVLGRSRQLP